MKKPTDILLENLELISKKLDLVEENIDISHKLINQVRQLSLSSIELTKNNTKVNSSINNHNI